MQSTEDAVSLFYKDQFPSSTNISSFLLIKHKISINLTLCPYCKERGSSISADHHTECHCYQIYGKCARCTCFNISKSILVQNFPCKNFHFHAKENHLNVVFYNSRVGFISLKVGPKNNVDFSFEETQKTSLSVEIRGSYQRVNILEGTLTVWSATFAFIHTGTMRNVLAHYFKASDGHYLAVKKMSHDSRIIGIEYFNPYIQTLTNLSNCNISGQAIYLIESKILDLSRNRIRHFSVNRRIEILYIQHNLLDAVALVKKIDPMESYVFLPLFNLSILDMSFNKITKLQQKDFEHFLMLISLNLSGNQIQDIDENTFSDLSKLVSIDLSGNDISVIQSGLFRSLRQLQFLYIQRNNIFQVSRMYFTV